MNTLELCRVTGDTVATPPDLDVAACDLNGHNAGEVRHRDAQPRFLVEMRAWRPFSEPELLNAIPVIGVAHFFAGEDELTPDPAGQYSDMMTVFLGPNAQEHSERFQSVLRDHWQWAGPVTHQALTEQTWEPLLNKAFLLFIMAESFDPSIQLVMQRANGSGVTAVVVTQDAASFPSDIAPVLQTAEGLDFTDALRALIGGVTNPGMICIDLADIMACLRHSRRLIQHRGTAPSVRELGLAAERALQPYGLTPADMPRIYCMLGWLTTGDAFEFDDYQQAINAFADKASAACQIIVAVELAADEADGACCVAMVGWM